jgi:pyruvate-ferredoxin/flavodoxin oxidoreductase
MVALAEERQQFWSQLRQLAGLEIPQAVHDTVVSETESDLEKRMDALRMEYEAKIAELKATLPAQIARRLADGLIRNAGSASAVADLLASLPAPVKPSGNGASPEPVATPLVTTAPVVETIAAPVATASAPAATLTAVAAPVAAADDEAIVLEAYIDSVRCTTCNECTNLNNRMFAYNGDKQAYVKDPHAGTFQQLVVAAERCPVSIIHPGSPLNPKEKDLPKWIKRAEKFN